MKKIILLIPMLFIMLFLQAQNKDVEGSEDYALLSRMPNYKIRNYKDFEFDKYEFRQYKDEKQSIEGRKIIIRYEHHNANNRDIKKPSYLQILRNYSNAIEKAGGQILFEHRNADFGHYFLKTDAGKEVWLEVLTAPDNGRRYTLTIIEREEMKQDILVRADLIKEKIKLEGKIALYGIYFDVGKTLIKPASKESLEQIALFLKDNAAVNCWIVGHTDSDGSFENNIKLSLGRAKSVITYLQNNYSISPDRLFPEGVGPLAPVSTNETEKGKKLNRRVELVKK